MPDILHFYKRRGHDKSATITLSDEITAVDQSFDASKLINKLTVVGMGPGSTHLEVTVEDAESQAKYGVMEGALSAKDIHDIDTLTSFANTALKQTVEAKHRMLIELAGSGRTDIELGDTVHVTYPDAGVDGDYRIISMERVSGVAGESIKLEMAAPQFRMTGMFADVERRADAEDYHPQGAPSIIPQHESDNVDSTHPLAMKFYIPEEAVDMGKLQIKEAKVALTLEAFRAYSTSAESGGGQTSSGGSEHTHGVSGQTAQSSGEHSHAVFEYSSDSPGAYTKRHFITQTGAGLSWINLESKEAAIIYTLGTAAHTHDVSGTTSSTEATHTHTVSNHTHGIAYGIYTSTLPASVYIKLNGVQIAGPFNADENIDITTEFLDRITTYGWNTLEFTSSQLGRIGATLFMRLFLQAG